MSPLGSSPRPNPLSSLEATSLLPGVSGGLTGFIWCWWGVDEKGVKVWLLNVMGAMTENKGVRAISVCSVTSGQEEEDAALSLPWQSGSDILLVKYQHVTGSTGYSSMVTNNKRNVIIIQLFNRTRLIQAFNWKSRIYRNRFQPSSRPVFCWMNLDIRKIQPKSSSLLCCLVTQQT